MILCRGGTESDLSCPVLNTGEVEGVSGKLTLINCREDYESSKIVYLGPF
jgi:hypothetical protein